MTIMNFSWLRTLRKGWVVIRWTYHTNSICTAERQIWRGKVAKHMKKKIRRPHWSQEWKCNIGTYYEFLRQHLGISMKYLFNKSLHHSLISEQADWWNLASSILWTMLAVGKKCFWKAANLFPSCLSVHVGKEGGPWILGK